MTTTAEHDPMSEIREAWVQWSAWKRVPTCGRAQAEAEFDKRMDARDAQRAATPDRDAVARIRAAGLTQQEIAATAGVSVGTVNADLKFNSENDGDSITNSRGQHRPATYTRTESSPDDIVERRHD